MSSFVKKKVSLDQDFIGSYLKGIREKKNKSLEEISQEIKVNLKYLKAIEDGAYQVLPQGAYSKIFFKKYIDYLGISDKNIVNDFVKEQHRNQSFGKSIFFNKVVSWKNLLSFPSIGRSFLIFFIVLACLLYLFFYFKNIFLAPTLEIYYPENNEITNDFFVEVGGCTEPESEVKINGQIVLIDKDSCFSGQVYLKSGVNTITITSKKKYSQENEVVRRVLVE
ncbi:MAG: helix-turn-helix domain-containing protein [Patescibacteria group bacterium]|jgi:cytoskeletal protein RodZ